MASSGNDSIFIPVKNQPRGTRYQVRWFDTETGREILSEATTVVVRYRLFQIADLCCTMDLISLKRDNGTLSKSETVFFGNDRFLLKNYLKPMKNKRI